MKSFHGNKAVDDVLFEVNRFEVVALLMENGAGRPAVISTLTGVHRRDSGVILLNDTESRDDTSFVHQDFGLVKWMTVEENIAGQQPSGSVAKPALITKRTVPAWPGVRLAIAIPRDLSDMWGKQ